MTTGAMATVRGWYERFFPERQIYHRCNGQVQFTTVSGRAQILAIMLVAGVLGWLAYASVNVIFVEQINAEIRADLRDSTRRWEAKLDQMQADYDRLHSAVAVVENELEGSLRELEDRQEQVDAVFEQKTSLLDPRLEDHASLAGAIFSPPENQDNASSSIPTLRDTDPTPRRSRYSAVPGQIAVAGLSELLNRVSTSEEHAALLQRRVADFQDLEVRISELESTQYVELVTLEERANDEIIRLERALAHTGLDLMAMVEENRPPLTDDMENGRGGPFISADVEDLSPDEQEQYFFTRKTTRIARNLQHLAALTDTVATLPLTRPVDVYRITSDFGPRHDPFNGRMTQHFGLDFAGRQGVPIVATADGTVTKSGWGSGYGNMVRIDHGNGFVTLYGHLNKRRVKTGDRVSRGQEIGTLGNTGRSTGPHLHYEIKYQGQFLNPERFLEAGRYVWENEG